MGNNNSKETYNADRLSRRAVSGYIHENTKSFIPKDVEVLILQFYALLVDEWREEYIELKDCIANERKLLIARYENITAFGSYALGKGTKFEWKLKISQEMDGYNRYPKILIGIMNKQDLANHMKNSLKMFHRERRGYAIQTYLGKKYHHNMEEFYCKGANYGDIITVIIDFTKLSGRLSYKVNGKSYGAAFSDIGIGNNQTYVLAVGIRNISDCISIQS